MPPAVAEARRRLGRAYRRLGHAIAGHRPDADTVDRVAHILDRTVDELAGFPELRRDVERRHEIEWERPVDDGASMFSFDERPVSGRSAPLGFDLDVVREGDEAVGRLTFGRAHEGAPNRAHGGMVSALFDDVFGFILSIEQQAGFTGELTVRYEAGTPIGTPLECRVRMTHREGRKMLMTGELTPDGDPSTVYARSRATFIAIDRDVFQRLVAAPPAV